MTEDAVAARLFVLRRTDDVGGVSGVGDVAEGVVFSDGTAVLRWTSAHRSTAVYANIEELDAIHGHDGRTNVVFTHSDAASPLREELAGYHHMAHGNGVLCPPDCRARQLLQGQVAIEAEARHSDAAEVEKLRSMAELDRMTMQQMLERDQEVNSLLIAANKEVERLRTIEKAAQVVNTTGMKAGLWALMKREAPEFFAAWEALSAALAATAEGSESNGTT